MTTTKRNLALLAFAFSAFVSNPCPAYAQISLGEQVDITRDVRGVPHIYATSDAGAYFGAGYAMAQDRYYQMYIAKMVVKGRISEFFGPGNLAQGQPLTSATHVKLDSKSRIMGWEAYCQNAVLELQSAAPGSPEAEVFELLASFVEGVNASVADRVGTPTSMADLAALNPLFAGATSNFGFPLEAFTVADAIGAWFNFGRHFQPSGFNETAGAQWRDNELSQYPPSMPLNVAEDNVLSTMYSLKKADDQVAAIVEVDLINSPRFVAMKAFANTNQNPYGVPLRDSRPNFTNNPPGPKFSQTWAVASSLTDSSEVGNHAILVGDPKIPVTNPAILYELHMSGATFNVRGAAIPGSPNILFGSTDNNAWSATALSLDMADLYKLNASPGASSLSYMLDGQSTKADTTIELIQIRGMQPIKVERVETVFGPIVNELIWPNAGDRVYFTYDMCKNQHSMLAPPVTEKYALSTAPLYFPELSTELGFLQMYRASNVDSFVDSLEHLRFPSVNVVFADASGDVGYMAAGTHILRNPSQFLAGVAAQDGTQSANAWMHLLPNDLKPWVTRPQSGYAHSANHMPIGSWYPLPRLFNASGDSDRSLAVRELIETRKAAAQPISVADMENLHNSTVNPLTRDLVQIAAHLKANGQLTDPKALLAFPHLNAWFQAGAKKDGTDPASLLATHFPIRIEDGRLDPQFPDKPCDSPFLFYMMTIYGSGPAGLSSFVRYATDEIDNNPTGVQFTGEEIQFVNAVLSFVWGSLNSKTPSDWANTFALHQKFSKEPFNSTFDSVSVGPTGMAPVDTTLHTWVGDVFTLADQASQGFPQVVVPGRDEMNWMTFLYQGPKAILPVGQSELASSPFYDNQLADWRDQVLQSSPLGVVAVAMQLLANTAIHPVCSTCP